RVASGVTSLGASPVPPLVSTSAQRSSSAQWRRRASICARSSGIRSWPASSSPRRDTSSHSAAPLSSSPSPLALDVLTVITAARVARSPSPATRSAPRARGGRRRAQVVAAAAALLQQDELLDLGAPLEPRDHA